MKVPKTFIPDKDLEKITKDLAKEEDTEGKIYFIDPEVKERFPNFVKYLKNKYDILYIQRFFDRFSWAWTIHTIEKKEKPVRLGTITEYAEKLGNGMIYGYEVEIRIKGEYSKLVYELDQKFDFKENKILGYKPKRLDEEEIPFP